MIFIVKDGKWSKNIGQSLYQQKKNKNTFCSLTSKNHAIHFLKPRNPLIIRSKQENILTIKTNRATRMSRRRQILSTTSHMTRQSITKLPHHWLEAPTKLSFKSWLTEWFKCGTHSQIKFLQNEHAFRNWIYLRILF